MDLANRCDRAAYAVRIERVDYGRRVLKLSESLPAKVLDGAVALIGNHDHREAWNLEEGRGSHSQGSEENSLLPVGGRVGRRPEERWMYLGWPNTDLSYPRELRMEDVPDADGDGRRTLKLLGAGKTTEPEGKPILELEVTRTGPERHTFYFKMPEDPGYQVGGWMYANRDGKRKVRAYLFGSRDELTVKAFVHVTRTDRRRHRPFGRRLLRTTRRGGRSGGHVSGGTSERRRRRGGPAEGP